MTPERRTEMALRAVSVLVVGSVAWALAALTWRLVGWDDGRTQVAVAETLSPLGVQAGGQDPDVARIVGLAPFGGADAAGGLPASDLGLILKGVLAAFPPDASTALISVGDGPARVYGVGQSPADNAVIEAIRIDHVVLNVGGVRQRLDFPAPTVAPVAVAAPPVAGAAARPGGPAGAAPPPSPGPSAPPPGPRPASPAPSSPSPAATAATAGMSATPSGYRVGPNPSPELRRLGLQPGDVIESLNDRPVSGATSDQQLFEQARAAGRAWVVVNRDGRRLTLNLPLR